MGKQVWCIWAKVLKHNAHCYGAHIEYVHSCTLIGIPTLTVSTGSEAVEEGSLLWWLTFSFTSGGQPAAWGSFTWGWVGSRYCLENLQRQCVIFNNGLNYSRERFRARKKKKNRGKKASLLARPDEPEKQVWSFWSWCGVVVLKPQPPRPSQVCRLCLSAEPLNIISWF